MLIIDLDTKSLKNNNNQLISNGIPLDNYKIDETPVSFELLEKLYIDYKYSVPNNVKYKKSYFKALSAKEMSTEQLVSGANRQNAKEKLELAVLTGILNKSLIWPDDTKWFWQSEKDKDFILLKKWF